MSKALTVPEIVDTLREYATCPWANLNSKELYQGAAEYIKNAASTLRGLMEINQELKAENARLREALGRAYEAVETCDETYPGSKYLNAELKAIRAALEPKGQKERRAKALAELAEMDADLLDLDPEVKP